MSTQDLHGLRTDYQKGALNEADLARDPFEQFGRWFEEARKVIDHDANAMTLATANKQGVPTARIVLLKEFGPAGFTFFTNYDSQKGRDLLENPLASLVFYWVPLERQVRIEGTVTRTSREASKQYFNERPRGSRIAASVSAQSLVIPSRKVLEEKAAELDKKYGEDVPLPDFWGGYTVNPTRVEFWQGRPSRLHDRILYSRDGNSWKIERLSP